MTFLNDTAFVAMDLETTGLRPPYARIVEIGAVRFVGDQVVDQFQALVNPVCRIPLDVIRIHGITNEMVKNEQPIQEVMPRFVKFAGDCPLIIHNAGFDMRFLLHDIPRCISNNWSAQVIDTLRLVRLSFPHLGRYSLESLVQSLRIPGTAAHRALADSVCAMHIFRRCIEKLDMGKQCDPSSFFSMHGKICSCASMAVSAISAVFPPGFELLESAMQNKQSICIVYCDAGGRKTKRTITPQAITSYGSSHTIEAFCHLRQDSREFRLDRIVAIEKG